MLRGARVATLPDQDLAGRRHAETVRSNLARTAAEVRVLELPGLGEKGDVSDWVAVREREVAARPKRRRELEEPPAAPPATPRAGPPPRPPAAGRPSRVRRASDIPPQA